MYLPLGTFSPDIKLGLVSASRNCFPRSLSEERTQRLLKACASKKITPRDYFVVGLPLHLDGGESQKSIEARQFATWLTDATGVPVEFFDERFTSVEAEQLLLEAEMTSKRRKRRTDMLAAQIMLSAYLESRAGGEGGEGGEPL